MLTFGKNKTPRYLHAFTAHELKNLLTENGFEVIGMETVARPIALKTRRTSQSSSGQKNILVVAKKSSA